MKRATGKRKNYSQRIQVRGYIMQVKRDLNSKLGHWKKMKMEKIKFTQSILGVRCVRFSSDWMPGCVCC